MLGLAFNITTYMHRDSNQATVTKRATEKAEMRKGTGTGSTPDIWASHVCESQTNISPHLANPV